MWLASCADMRVGLHAVSGQTGTTWHNSIRLLSDCTPACSPWNTLVDLGGQTEKPAVSIEKKEGKHTVAAS